MAMQQEQETMPLGVMKKEYAHRRRVKPHLAFRLNLRSLAAANAITSFHERHENFDILDLGAAEGAATLKLHHLVKARSSKGIEYSASLIEQAEELPPSVELVQGDACNLDGVIEDESVDIVTALAVLEHCDAPQKLFSEVRRVLKPGGLFVATCPSNTWDELSDLAGLSEGDHHVAVIDKNGFEKMATDEGLVNLEYRRFMFAPVASIPYLNIPVPSELAFYMDRFIYPLKVFNFLFVNQLFVAKRPE